MDWKEALSGAFADHVPQTDVQKIENTEESEVQKTPLHIVVERKGRNGKTATIVEGFTCTEKFLNEIAKELKMKIGTGGSARGGEILLQGEWKDKCKQLLLQMGFKTK